MSSCNDIGKPLTFVNRSQLPNSSFRVCLGILVSRAMSTIGWNIHMVELYGRSWLIPCTAVDNRSKICWT